MRGTVLIKRTYTDYEKYFTTGSLSFQYSVSVQFQFHSFVVPESSSEGGGLLALHLHLLGHLALHTARAEEGGTAVTATVSLRVTGGVSGQLLVKLVIASHLNVVSGPGRVPEPPGGDAGQEAAEEGTAAGRGVETVGILADQAGGTPGTETT